MDPILSKRKETERQERIHRILKAGKKIFLSNGYFGANIRDIAREATLAPATIYYYFKGIDEIYAKICEEAFEIVINLFTKATSKDGTALEKLKNIAGAYLAFYTEYKDYFELFILRNLGYRKVGLDNQHLKKLDALSIKTLAIINDIIEEGIKQGEIIEENSWKLSLGLWAGIEGLLFIDTREFLATYNINIEDMVKSQIELLARGLRK